MLSPEQAKKVQALEQDMGLKVTSESDLAKMTDKALESYVSYLESNAAPAKPSKSTAKVAAEPKEASRPKPKQQQ